MWYIVYEWQLRICEIYKGGSYEDGIMSKHSYELPGKSDDLMYSEVA